MLQSYIFSFQETRRKTSKSVSESPTKASLLSVLDNLLITFCNKMFLKGHYVSDTMLCGTALKNLQKIEKEKGLLFKVNVVKQKHMAGWVNSFRRRNKDKLPPSPPSSNSSTSEQEHCLSEEEHGGNPCIMEANINDNDPCEGTSKGGMTKFRPYDRFSAGLFVPDAGTSTEEEDIDVECESMLSVNRSFVSKVTNVCQQQTPIVNNELSADNECAVTYCKSDVSESMEIDISGILKDLESDSESNIEDEAYDELEGLLPATANSTDEWRSPSESSVPEQSQGASSMGNNQNTTGPMYISSLVSIVDAWSTVRDGILEYFPDTDFAAMGLPVFEQEYISYFIDQIREHDENEANVFEDVSD